MPAKRTQDWVNRALAGDETALNQLVDDLSPVIQARIARRLLLYRAGSAAGRSIRQEVEDLVQEVFLVLFANNGKVLRSWQADRGLSLENFIGLVAERQAASILRSGKRSPWTEDPTLTEELDGEEPDSGPEEIAASREELGLLLERLPEKLSPLGRQLFDLLFLQEMAVVDITRTTGMSADAIYAWRSRLRRLVRQLRQELSELPSRATKNIRGTR